MNIQLLNYREQQKDTEKQNASRKRIRPRSGTDSTVSGQQWSTIRAALHITGVEIPSG
jgi:hypothetical protein